MLHSKRMPSDAHKIEKCHSQIAMAELDQRFITRCFARGDSNAQQRWDMWRTLYSSVTQPYRVRLFDKLNKQSQFGALSRITARRGATFLRVE